MNESDTFVRKACVYLTREDGAVLVFEGPDHDGLQVPKGTVEAGERAREAAFREVAEESGLGALNGTREVASDCWHRRETATGDRWYVRHFFHASAGRTSSRAAARTPGTATGSAGSGPSRPAVGGSHSTSTTTSTSSPATGRRRRCRRPAGRRRARRSGRTDRGVVSRWSDSRSAPARRRWR